MYSAAIFLIAALEVIPAPNKRENLLIIFGGRSSEHEVSCMSAVNVTENVDKTKYNVTLVGITKSGKWLLVDDIKQVKDGSWTHGRVRAILSPDAQSKSLYFLRDRDGDEMFASNIRIDVIFTHIAV